MTVFAACGGCRSDGKLGVCLIDVSHGWGSVHDGWAALQTFQARDLFALLTIRLLRGGEFAEHLEHQSLKLWTA